MPAPAFDAVILAGGAGRRAGGADKGWCLHQGQALVEIALQRLRGQAGTVWIAANRNLARYAALGAPVLADGAPGAGGPLAGIARALAACRTPWLLSVPVDAPDYPGTLLPRLLAAAATHAGPVVAAEPDRLQPLFALYPRTLAPAAAAAMRNGELAVWRFLLNHAAQPVPFEPGAFSNLNAAGLG